MVEAMVCWYLPEKIILPGFLGAGFRRSAVTQQLQPGFQATTRGWLRKMGHSGAPMVAFERGAELSTRMVTPILCSLKVPGSGRRWLARTSLEVVCLAKNSNPRAHVFLCAALGIGHRKLVLATRGLLDLGALFFEVACGFGFES